MVAFELTRGSRVEVSSDDVGFKDAWYVATVVDVIQTSPKKKGSNSKSKSKKKTGYLVKYDSLFAEDDISQPLTEIVDSSFVRPSPPRYPRRNNENDEAEEAGDDGGVGFKLYDVVDAYYLDGWWTGVVTKVIVDGEIRSYIVSFQSPPEEFEFERSNLRLHVDWIGSRWRFPAKKTQEQTSKSTTDVTPSKGSLTTVRSRNPRSCAKKKIYSRKRPRPNSRNKDYTEPVEENSPVKIFQCSRSLKPYKKGNMENMESLKGSSRSRAIHQDSLISEQETVITTPEGTVTGKHATRTPSKGALTASSLGNKRSSAKKKSHLQKKLKTNHKNKDIMGSVEKSSRAKRFQPSRDKKGNMEDTESPRGSIGVQAMNQDSPVLEPETLITNGEGGDGSSQQKRKRGRPPKTPVKTPIGFSKGNEETREMDSSVINEVPSDLDEEPLFVWCQGLNPLMASKDPRVPHISPLDHPDGPNNISNHEAHQNPQELPFTKSSPIWATLESLPLYQNPPQNPQFSPLYKVKEDHREGLAIGHMVTFGNVVHKTSRLQLTDPNNVINSSLDTLVDLETHGFNVGAVRARLNELLVRKVSLGQLSEESNVVKNELMKVNLAKSAMEEEISETVGKMKELQEKLAQAVTRKHMKHDEGLILKSKLRVIYDQMEEVKVDFENIVATPLS